MGLDMYAFTTNETFDEPVDFKPDEYQEIHYWRKHPNLHGWMERLYFEKGGQADCFNCVTVSLDSDDLNQLETAIHMSDLPITSGFFFGQSDGTEVDDDLAFVKAARAAIAEGKTVYYDSWW